MPMLHYFPTNNPPPCNVARSDSEFDEFEGQTVRFKPESIDNLVKLTKFNKRELKLMYRGFKQVSCHLTITEQYNYDSSRTIHTVDIHASIQLTN